MDTHLAPRRLHATAPTAAISAAVFGSILVARRRIRCILRSRLARSALGTSAEDQGDEEHSNPSLPVHQFRSKASDPARPQTESRGGDTDCNPAQAYYLRPNFNSGLKKAAFFQ